jgi:RNA polymerase-binding transcription factor DksA
MIDKPLDREKLEKRRAEILQQLDRLEGDLRIELDRDPEEQAIQVEQNEVSIAMEQSLRRELATIEENLASIVD